MPVKKFDISQADALADYLGITIEKAAERTVLAVAHRIVSRILTVIIPAQPQQPVDRGAYRAAWRAKKTVDGAEVRNDMPYASIIEDGAKAENIKIGRKMIDALADWVLRKGLVKPAGRGARAKTEARAAARSVAWAIAMKMKERGIFDGGKGLKILEKACEGLDRMYLEELGEELKRQYRSK